MLKKTTLAIATAATLGIAALAPSTASAKTSIHVGFYGGGFGFGVHAPYYGGYYAPRRYRKRCHRRWRKVHTYYGWRWKKVRICRRYY